LDGAPFAVLHAWQSAAPPPQTVSQQTPSMQKPLAQSMASEHAPPRTPGLTIRAATEAESPSTVERS